MSDQKEYFRHSQLIAEVRSHLKSAALRDRFIEGLELYGLRGIRPDFEDCPELKTAFAKVLPEMAKGWAASQAAGYSNAVQASRASAKKAKEKAPAQSAEPSPAEALQAVEDMPPKPRHEAPSPEFVEMLKGLGFVSILSAPEPLSAGELHWLINWLGPEVASCLVWHIEAAARKIGKEFFNKNGSNVLDLCTNKYGWAVAAFDKKLESACPRLFSMPKRLTFANYQRLRCRYGRANVWCKIFEQEGQKNFNLKVNSAEVLERYIKASIKRGVGVKFGLPSFDDEGTETADGFRFISRFSYGFDKAFDLKPSKIFDNNF